MKTYLKLFKEAYSGKFFSNLKIPFWISLIMFWCMSFLVGSCRSHIKEIDPLENWAPFIGSSILIALIYPVIKKHL